MEGTIDRFLDDKGCGFVQNEGGRWWFHESAVFGVPVTKGDRVTFSIVDDERRPGEVKAIDVQKLGNETIPISGRLFVANLPFSLNETELAEHFSKFGAVVKVELLRVSGSGESRGFGFVQMSDTHAALNCIAKLHCTDLQGRRITVRAEKPRQGRS